MITITHESGCIKLIGHAGYAPHGQDVVCAAVSTLLQAFCLSIYKLTQDEVKTDLKPGNAVIEYGNLSESGKLLVDSFFVGAKMIADEFPDYVRVE
jgi:uncharacterized protein YsxB (DUF464 family)